MFDDEGHGLAAPANQEKAWGAIAGFLRAHLGTPTSAADAPAGGG